MDYQRLEDIRRSKEIDAILITDRYNMRYITGYRGEGMYLYTKYGRYILTDSRYTEQAILESPISECVDITSDGYAKKLAELLADDIKRIGFENQSISYRLYEEFSKRLDGITFIGLDDSIDKLRAIKDEEEIENIRMAEKIGDEAFSYILKYIKPGVTEKEIALKLEYYMKSNGAEALSFDTIVASGKNSSMPHAIPTDKAFEAGDFVTMDFGCIYQGYCSDMTRTVAIGNVSAKQRSIYDIVLKAQQEALKAIKPGMKCNEIDKLARDIIRDAGYGNCFGHGLGHSVGLFIHEEPRFSMKCNTTLVPGMVLTVEPGIYLPGQFGVRIEDLIVVTENGYTNLTSSEKDLIIV